MSFAPVYNEHSRALILGTWPSPKSREMAFYYGHPQNRFWPMMAALTGEPVPKREDIEAKKQIILRHGLALWDTLESCTITGASDAPSGTWCPTTSPLCCRRCPLRRCSATGPRPIAFIQSICSRSPALRRSNCPAPARPMRPAARRCCGRCGARRWQTGSPNNCQAVNSS